MDFRRCAEKMRVCILFLFIIFRLHLEQSLKCTSLKAKTSDSDDEKLIRKVPNAAGII